MKWFHTIFFKLLICLLLISIIPLSIVGFVTYYKFSQNMMENIKVQANSTLERKVERFNTLYNDLKRVEDGMKGDGLFSTFSKNKDLNTHYQLFIQLDNLSKNVNEIMPNLGGITLINENGFIYNYGYSLNRSIEAADIYETDWFQSFKNYTQPQITNSHNRNYSNFDTNKLVYSYIHKIWDNKLKSFSYIIIDFKEGLMGDIFNNKSINAMSAGTFIYEKDGFVLLPKKALGFSFPIISDSKTGSTITSVHGKEFILFKRFHPITNWTIVEYFEVNSFFKSISETRMIMGLTMFFSAIICIFASLFVSHKISKPINKMKHKMAKVRSGYFEPTFFSNSKDEIGELGRGFNQMLYKIQELISSVRHEESLKRKAEMTALQLQINPHFLYNTLESINAMARKKEAYEISNLIVLLGKLLRLSIGTFDEKINIRQEISYIEVYLKIHKERMGNLLQYDIIIDTSIYDYITIKWILQPIVENSIIHGIDTVDKKGNVTVIGRVYNDNIVFKVTDNGKGIDPISLNKIREKLEFKSSILTKYKKRVGIYNVQTRIRTYYGKNYGLSIDSVVGNGTVVTIKIPKEEGQFNVQDVNS